MAASKDENTDAAAGSEVTCWGGNLKSVCVVFFFFLFCFFGGGGGGDTHGWEGHHPGP